MLIDDGLLRARRGLGASRRPVEHHDSADDPGPARRAARSARPEERAVIERASVIGRVFWWGAVAELVAAGAAAPRRASAVAHAEGADPAGSLEIAGEDAFRFAHILDPGRRLRGHSEGASGELHERFAAWIEARATRPRRRVRGDRRLPPRAGVPLRCVELGRERAHRAHWESRGRAARLGRPARPRPRRHAGRRQPARRAPSAAPARDPDGWSCSLRARIRAARNGRLRRARRPCRRDHEKPRRPPGTPSGGARPHSRSVGTALHEAGRVGGGGRSEEAGRAMPRSRELRDERGLGKGGRSWGSSTCTKGRFRPGRGGVGEGGRARARAGDHREELEGFRGSRSSSGPAPRRRGERGSKRCRRGHRAGGRATRRRCPARCSYPGRAPGGARPLRGGARSSSPGQERSCRSWRWPLWLGGPAGAAGRLGRAVGG